MRKPNASYLKGWNDCLAAVKAHLTKEGEGLMDSTNPYGDSLHDAQLMASGERLKNVADELDVYVKPGES